MLIERGIKEDFLWEWGVHWMCRTTKTARKKRLEDVFQAEAL